MNLTEIQNFLSGKFHFSITAQTSRRKLPIAGVFYDNCTGTGAFLSSAGNIGVKMCKVMIFNLSLAKFDTLCIIEVY